MSNPAGGLLLMLLAIFLLVEFFAGNLEWLFNLKTAVDAGASGVPAGSTGPAGPTAAQLTRLPRGQTA